MWVGGGGFVEVGERGREREREVCWKVQEMGGYHVVCLLVCVTMAFI